jgi:hypothetical protein
MEQMFRNKAGESVLICSMQQGDLDAADYVTRLAFGTFLGMPDPLQFMGDASYIHTRWKADPARLEAYKLMLANGYATNVQGVVMQQPGAGYNREDVFLIDDWR